jgi:redox-sensitive bicupin YhaK (pirin superfamily)
MNKVIHKAETRGKANIGWLESYHTFSFSRYYDTERIQFGALRVINDDTVAPGMGFGRHPHDNMEIITIPLSGDLKHKDSMGHVEVIRSGDVQIMSAGTGIEHSEINANYDSYVKLLQIWVFPKLRNVTPRYEQKTYSAADRKNQWQVVVGPQHPTGVDINQDAWFSLIEPEKGKTFEYKKFKADSGIYFFLIEGSANLADTVMERRDGMGITDADNIKIEALQDSYLLAMEVPMGY